MGDDANATEMADLNTTSDDKGPTSSSDGGTTRQESMITPLDSVDVRDDAAAPVVYKKYKRRWFGLLQLVLLNIIVSWDWLTYSPVVDTSATFFSTTPAIVNWASTVFLFAFVVSAPFLIFIVDKYGPKVAIMIASALILVGNWVRYAAVRASPPSLGGVFFGQILIGVAQPFVLAVPTSYSDLWFSPRGRVSATAIASLANPLGGAIAQLVNPFLVVKASDTAPLTLYIAIISSVACVPSFFIPARPPTPVAASSTISRPSLKDQTVLLARNKLFWIVFGAFSIYVGFFNSISSLLAQSLTPYGFSQNDAGIAGAILILVGLGSAAVASPLVDKYKPYVTVMRSLLPIIGACYIAFIWAPPAGTIVAADIICAVLGASSFILVPVVLEWLVEITFPVGPEVTSVVCWSGGQFLGGIFIVISEALEAGPHANPPYNLQNALIFQAVLAGVTVFATLAFGRVGSLENKRLDIDRGGGATGGAATEGHSGGRVELVA